MKNNNWFEVDKEGLKSLQLGKPKTYVVRELIQNAIDEDITNLGARLIMLALKEPLFFRGIK